MEPENNETVAAVGPDALAGEFAEQMRECSLAASVYLKALSHPDRLMILCHLIEGERTVTELEHLVGTRQSSVSQHLAKLRGQDIVSTRREGKAVHYSISDVRTREIMLLLHKLFLPSTSTE
ncbi:MAG: metalloregulator ArsR/SmtB family transcription factor [Pseudomonadota bacterium]